MKRSIITYSILVSGIIACSIFVAGCTSKSKQEHDATKNDSTQLMGYACPMHPETTGKEGDKCSKCGMKLEAVKTSDSTATQHNH